MKCLFCKKEKAKKKYCSRKCSKNAWTKNNRKREDITWYSIRHRALRDKIEYLNKENYKEWLGKQPQICHYCGIPRGYLYLIKQIGEQWNMGLPAQWVTSMEFQVVRKNPNKGYSAKNMVLACAVCNRLKSNNWSYREFKTVSKMYSVKKWQRVVNKAIR